LLNSDSCEGEENPLPDQFRWQDSQKATDDEGPEVDELLAGSLNKEDREEYDL
jgi:hypothetical protein